MIPMIDIKRSVKTIVQDENFIDQCKKQKTENCEEVLQLLVPTAYSERYIFIHEFLYVFTTGVWYPS